MLNFWRRAVQGQVGERLPQLPSGYTAVNAIKRQGIWYYQQIVWIDHQMHTISKIESVIKGSNLDNYGPQVISPGFGGGDGPTWNSYINNQNRIMIPELTVAQFTELNEYTKMTYINLVPTSTVTDTATRLFGYANWTFTDFGFKYIKVYDFNDELIAYLQPCLRDSDGVAGYYDLVANEFRSSRSTDSQSQWTVDTSV